MMNNFAAIDFEIANQHRSSVCSVGAVIVRNGRITDKIYRLVRPEPEWYLWRITQIHGLTAEDTENEKVFPHVWDEIAPIIDGLPLVAQTARSTRVVYGRYSAYIKWIIPIINFTVLVALHGKRSGIYYPIMNCPQWQRIAGTIWKNIITRWQMRKRAL